MVANIEGGQELELRETIGYLVLFLLGIKTRNVSSDSQGKRFLPDLFGWDSSLARIRNVFRC